jgi:phosphoribosyl 1,2-cyclic phosphodiesterase
VQFASLGSGSKGNATLVEENDTCILIDCGFTLKETEQRLGRLGKSADQLTAILVTHEHGDHASGVMPLSRKYNIPVYATMGTSRACKWVDEPTYECVDMHYSFAVKGLQVQPVAVPHDAKEPSQFVVSNGVKRFGLLTDVGSITPHMREHYYDCDAYFVECNHDIELLKMGLYPEMLKRRVGGDYGHLNNDQAANFLKSVMTQKTQHVVIGHLSEKNNTPAHALKAVVGVLNCAESDITIANQKMGFEWRII